MTGHNCRWPGWSTKRVLSTGFNTRLNEELTRQRISV